MDLPATLDLQLENQLIGAAKSRLIGDPVERDGETFLVDKDEVIGAVVTTKQGAKPIYVSIGHMVSLETAIKIVKHCVQKAEFQSRLLQAHKLATKERNRLDSGKQSKYH